MDQISINRIQSAHPVLRDELLTILKDCEIALSGRADVRFTFVLRSLEEQQAIFAQGRQAIAVVNNLRAKVKMPPITVAENKIVSYAQPGSSYHNYGLAVDIVLIIDGRTAAWDVITDFDGDRVADWMEVVKIFKKYGWTWGGDWVGKKYDAPHFQKTFGLSIADCRRRVASKSFIPGTSYITI